MYKRRLFSLILVLTMICGLLITTNNTTYAATPEQWKAETPMPVAQHVHSSQAIGDKIYVMGGRDNNGAYTNNLMIYDTQTSSWTTGASMPNSSTAAASGVVNNKIYVFGGAGSDAFTSSYDKVEIYDPATNVWSSGAPMPNKATGIDAVVYGSKVYVLGGVNNNTDYNFIQNIQIYDTLTNTWSIGASLPEGKYSPTVQIFGNKIYMIGGSKNLQAGSNDVYIYDILTNTWSKGSNMPTIRAQTSSIISGHKIYVFGGYNGSSAINTTEVYDVLNDKWDTSFPNLTQARRHLTSNLVGDKAYLIGGLNTNSMNLVESINIADEEKLYVLLYVGESTQLSVTHNLTDNLKLTWNSSLQNIAKVDSNGVVTALDVGVTYIIASDSNGNFVDYIPVKVIEDQTYRLAVDLKIGQKAKLYLAPNPLNVNWSSNNSNIAIVSNIGEVIAISKGLTIITGEINNKTYQIYIRVNP